MTATLFVHIVGTEKVLEHSKRSRLVMIFEKLSALIAEQFNVDPDTITNVTSFEDDLNRGFRGHRGSLHGPGGGIRH